MRPRLLTWSLGGAGLAGLALAVRRRVEDRQAGYLSRALLGTPDAHLPLTDPLLEGVPEPARRYLGHALPPGAPLARAVRLWMEGTLVPAKGADPVAFTAEEVLAPPRGFVWTARATMKGLPVRVRDHYARGAGGLRVALLGLLPLASNDGADVTRSARGRLAGEAVWCPAALLPGLHTRWEAVDADRARATLTIDGADVPLTLTVDEDGRLREVTMMRWGDVGVPDWQLIPYGFAVEAEAPFDGVTIPTQLTGGWWYGTPRYDASTAATFTVPRARFAPPPAAT